MLEGSILSEENKQLTGILKTENRSGETKQFTKMTTEWVSWEAQVFSFVLQVALFSHAVKRHSLSAMRQSHSWIMDS